MFTEPPSNPVTMKVSYEMFVQPSAPKNCKHFTVSMKKKTGKVPICVPFKNNV